MPIDVLTLTSAGNWKPAARDVSPDDLPEWLEMYRTPCKHSGQCRFPFHNCGHEPVTITERK